MRDKPAHGPWGPIHHLLVNALGRPPKAAKSAGLLPSSFHPHWVSYTDGMAVDGPEGRPRRHLLDEGAASELLDEPLTGRELDVLRLLQGVADASTRSPSR